MVIHPFNNHLPDVCFVPDTVLGSRAIAVNPTDPKSKQPTNQPTNQPTSQPCLRGAVGQLLKGFGVDPQGQGAEGGLEQRSEVF